MKKISLLLLLVPILLVGGCNYHELNDIYLVSALSVDYDSEYKVSLLTVSDNEESPTRFIEGYGKNLRHIYLPGRRIRHHAETRGAVALQIFQRRQCGYIGAL